MTTKANNRPEPGQTYCLIGGRDSRSILGGASLAAAKIVTLECQECGREFRHTRPNILTRCPGCGSGDLEVL